MLVRIKVKLADVLDGIDLSHSAEGDVINVAERDGAILIAEGWAEAAAGDEMVTCAPVQTEREVAADDGVPSWNMADGSRWWEDHSSLVPASSSKHDI
jgi:hypothetical protein